MAKDQKNFDKYRVSNKNVDEDVMEKIYLPDKTISMSIHYTPQSVGFHLDSHLKPAKLRGEIIFTSQ